MSDSLWPHGLYSPWDSPGQNTRIFIPDFPKYWSSISLLQGIFPTWGSNPCLPHYRQILYQLSHKGSPRILEWVAYPFSSESSQSRSWTSHFAGRFFTSWAIREASDGSNMIVFAHIAFSRRVAKTVSSNLALLVCNPGVPLPLLLMLKAQPFCTPMPNQISETEFCTK